MKNKSERSCSKGCLCDVCSGQSKSIKSEGILKTVKDLAKKAKNTATVEIGKSLTDVDPDMSGPFPGIGAFVNPLIARAAKNPTVRKVANTVINTARNAAPHISAIGESRGSQEDYDALKWRYEQDKKLFDETPEKDSESRAHRSYIMNQSLARLKSHPLHPKNEMSEPLPGSSQDLENKKTQQRSKANALALSVMQENANLQNKVTTDTYSFRQGAPEHVGTWTGNTFKANDPTHEVYGDKGPYQKRYKTAPGRTLSSLPHENPPNEVHVVRKPTQELNKNDEDSVNHWHDHHESMAAMYGHMAKTTGTSKEKYDWRAKQAAHQDEAMRVKPVLDPFGKIKQPHHVDDFKKYIPKPHSNEPFTHEDIKENFLTPNEEAITNVSGLLPKNHLFLNRLLTHKNSYARKLGEIAKTQLSKLDFHGAARTLAQGRHHIVDENLQTDKPEKENEHFGDDISVKGTAYSLRDVGKHLNTALNHRDGYVRSMGKEAEQHIRNGNLAQASLSLTKAHRKIQSMQTTVEEKDMLRESHFKEGDFVGHNSDSSIQGVKPRKPHEVVKVVSNPVGVFGDLVTYHLKDPTTGNVYPVVNAHMLMKKMQIKEELKTVKDVIDTLPLGVEKQGPGEKYGNEAKGAPAVKPNPTTGIVSNKTGEGYKKMSNDKYAKLAEAAFGSLNRSNPFRSSSVDIVEDNFNEEETKLTNYEWEKDSAAVEKSKDSKFVNKMIDKWGKRGSAWLNHPALANKKNPFRSAPLNEEAPMYNVRNREGVIVGVHQHGKGFTPSRPDSGLKPSPTIPDGHTIDRSSPVGDRLSTSSMPKSSSLNEEADHDDIIEKAKAAIMKKHGSDGTVTVDRPTANKVRFSHEGEATPEELRAHGGFGTMHDYELDLRQPHLLHHTGSSAIGAGDDPDDLTTWKPANPKHNIPLNKVSKAAQQGAMEEEVEHLNEVGDTEKGREMLKKVATRAVEKTAKKAVNAPGYPYDKNALRAQAIKKGQETVRRATQRLADRGYKPREESINQRFPDVERDIAAIMKESYKKKRMQEEAMNIYIASSEQREDWLNVGRGSMDVLDYINKYKV